MKRELLMFVDERIETDAQSQRFVVGCIVVSKKSWEVLHREARRIGATRPPRRLDLMVELLDRLQGFALLAYADLPVELVRGGEIDGTDDIPKIARRDNVWSQAVLAAAAAVLACLRTGGVGSAEIDLHYDPKSLTLAHRDAYEKTLRDTLPNIAREDPVSGVVQSSPTLTFRHINQVPKRRGEMEADQLQHGTSLAHHLCSRAEDIIVGRGAPRIIARNHTDVLRSMVLKFTEDSGANQSRRT